MYRSLLKLYLGFDKATDLRLNTVYSISFIAQAWVVIVQDEGMASKSCRS